MIQPPKPDERQLKLEELRRLVAEGHASGTSPWTGTADIIAEAHKAAGL